MNLIHILLPLNDNEGRPQKRAHFHAVSRELTDKFGGVTAHSRAPAEGVWQQGEGEASANRDEIVIYEVMAQEIDEAWWKGYRHKLEGRFKQQQVVIRAHAIQML